jgi:hypothetical protein
MLRCTSSNLLTEAPTVAGWRFWSASLMAAAIRRAVASNIRKSKASVNSHTPHAVDAYIGAEWLWVPPSMMREPSNPSTARPGRSGSPEISWATLLVRMSCWR